MDKYIQCLAYFIIMIPGIFLFYYLLQSFNYEKILKAGKVKEFRILYILICVILASLLAWSVVEAIARLTQIFSGATGA